MSEVSAPEHVVRVGLEVHQQLSSERKLFCPCKSSDSSRYDYEFERKLRPTRSEMGSMDAAALFESNKERIFRYSGSFRATCLVEADEEPPYSIDKWALDTALIVALALHSSIEDEFHTMRKIVIDGSNTTGFQRTVLIARGGFLEVKGTKIGVQSICLEEDAAKIVNDQEIKNSFSLDRLGIPLIEVALQPVVGSGQVVTEIAATLGRLLRSTKRVTRGIGSIRQDVNISLDDGPIVEIKGVQQLWKLSQVIEYETHRQHVLIRIARRIRDRISARDKEKPSTKDVTIILRSSESSVVQKILNGVDNKIIAINVPHFSGMLGKQPNTEIRLGKQLSEFVRFYGLGGIFHSDELPNYGISKGDVTKIKQEIGTADDDAFILVGGPDKLIKLVERDLYARLNSAINGVVAETRSVLPDGSTIFMRPRPGSARMYPETDIPYFTNDQKDIENLKNLVPLPWDKLLSSLGIKYGLNTKLAIQIYDSEYFDLFEDIASASKIPANFIASILTEDFVSFRRQGLDTSLLNEDLIGDAFKRLNEGKIAKESLPLIFEKILKKEASDLDEAISLLDITTISNEALKETIDKVIFDNQSIVVRTGNSSMGFLMGRCMAILRGKVDGEKVNRLVAARLRYFLNKTKGN